MQRNNQEEKATTDQAEFHALISEPHVAHDKIFDCHWVLVG